jgi:putative endonuclease
MQPCIYILRSLVNSRYYIGSTDNILRRIDEHNNGKSIYTRLTKPFELVFSQNFATLSEARSIEYRLKKMKRRDILERIIENGVITLK